MNDCLGCWIDGISETRIPADDRGLSYGDGLFETVLVRLGKPRFLDAHLARLSLGCQRLGIALPSMPALRAEIAAAVAQAPPLAIVKLVVTRGSATRRGYAPGAETARRIVSLWPCEPLPTTARAGVDLRVSGIHVAEQPALAGIKHLNRLEQVLAAGEARTAGVFDVVMLDTSGFVVSGAMSNLFLVSAGEIRTAPMDRAGVAGVMRRVVQRECSNLGIPFRECRFALEELYAADEAFITNARIGVVPVRHVGEHRFIMNRVALMLRDHVESLDA